MEWVQFARDQPDNNDFNHPGNNISPLGRTSNAPPFPRYSPDTVTAQPWPSQGLRIVETPRPQSTGQNQSFGRTSDAPPFPHYSPDTVTAQPWPSQGLRIVETPRPQSTGQNPSPQLNYPQAPQQNMWTQPQYYRPNDEPNVMSQYRFPPNVSIPPQYARVGNARAIFKKEFPVMECSASAKTYDKAVQRPAGNVAARLPRAICKKQPQPWASWDVRKNEAPRYAQNAAAGDVRAIRGSSRWYTDAVQPGETPRPFNSVTLSRGLPSPSSLMSHTVVAPNRFVGPAMPSTSLMPPSWFLPQRPAEVNSVACLDHMFKCLAIDLCNPRNMLPPPLDPRGGAGVVWRPAAEEARNHGSGLGESKQYGVPLPRQEEGNSGARWPNYSKKVFVGGLPPDIDCDMIGQSFEMFGALQVGWPHKNEEHSIHPPKGFAFLQFDSAESVHLLVQSCQMSDSDGYFTLVSSHSVKDRVVQIRPWIKDDAECMIDQEELVQRNTVFVGGVPRPLTARELARVMSNMFGPVCYAGIDIDPDLGYPKGAGRVTFKSHDSCISAISSRFVQLNMGDMRKSIEVKAFVLQDQGCDGCSGRYCGNKAAAFFCTNVGCLKYFCPMCWANVHEQTGKEFHKPTLQKCNSSDRRV